MLGEQRGEPAWAMVTMIDPKHLDRRSDGAISPVPGHEPARWRRWFQYRLRTLLIVIVMAALVSAAWAKYVEPYRRERQLERMVTALGGSVSTEAAGPEWLQLIVGPGSTSVVTTISLSPSTASVGWNGWTDLRPDAELLDRIACTQRLRSLELAHRQLEDDDLVRLMPLQSLEKLDLSYCSITDAGVDLGEAYIEAGRSYPMSLLVPLPNSKITSLWFGPIVRTDGMFNAPVLVPIDVRSVSNELK